LSWTPARVPERISLDGELVRLEPLDAGRHGPSLYRRSHGEGGDPAIWSYLAYGPFENEAAFTTWLGDRAASSDPWFYAVVDLGSGEARGMVSYLRADIDHGVIEIGHIWFAPVMQRTRQSTEAIYLLARHAFDELGYRRLEWKCDSMNLPSRRAAERFGFVYEGVFRQHMVVKGRNRDTAWFSITDGEWPDRRAAFQAWLALGNFDRDGRQRRGLAEMRKRPASESGPSSEPGSV
jgi:RimJ/RimL family protein N-acetyltransferase